MKSKTRDIVRRALGVAACATVIVSVTACGILRPTRGRREAAAHSGFLGDYSNIQPREGYEAQEIYINPKADWAGYDAIYLDSASLWLNDDGKLTAEDRQALTDILYTSFAEKLGERFKLVGKPGPGVARVRVAFTEAKGANVPANAVTTLVPQLRTVTAVGTLLTDAAVFVGSASIEGDVTDSVTNERLAAMVDSRAGTKSVVRAFGKWDDVEAACDYWAGRTADFLTTQGVQLRPGAVVNQGAK